MILILCSIDAGWSSPEACQAHNLKVAGSNPAPATNLFREKYKTIIVVVLIHRLLRSYFAIGNSPKAETELLKLFFLKKKLD